MKASVDPHLKSALTPSWDLLPRSITLLRQNFTAVMYLFLFPGLLLVFGDLLVGSHLIVNNHLSFTMHQAWGLGIIGVSLLWSFVNLGPSTYFQLHAAAGKPETVGDYYRHGLRFTWRIWAYEIIFGLSVLIGFVLLIVPAFIVLRRYILANYYLVDSDLSIRQAMKRSAQDSKPVSGAIWGVIGVNVAFAIAASALGLIPLIGAIISELAVYPCLFLFVLRYREIRSVPVKA